MVYLSEIDGSSVRQEVRRGYASNRISWWPKWPGVGNVLLLSTPTAALYKPASSTTALVSSATTALTTVEGVSRLTITVDCTDADAWALDEHYRADISWRYTDADGVVWDELTSLRFDVCREPYTPNISLNDLQDMVPDIGPRLLTAARVKKSDRTAEQMASVLGVQAWADIRQRVAGLLAGTEARIIPRAILPREALHSATCAQAIRRCMLGNLGEADSETQNLLDTWIREVDNRLLELGSNIAFDSDDDGSEDSALPGLGSVVIRRAQ